MSGSKMYFFQQETYLSLEEIAKYVTEFHNSTGLVPTCVRLSNERFYDLVRSCFSQTTIVTSTNGNKPVQYILTPVGYLPLLNAIDDKSNPKGFIVIEDEEFDKQFENIVLKDRVRLPPKQ